MTYVAYLELTPPVIEPEADEGAVDGDSVVASRGVGVRDWCGGVGSRYGT